MANAARVHAVEHGKDIAANTMIAFGGAAPLHAARLCEKLGIGRCLIPRGAGVGSAIGFLRAPFAYEALASCFMPLSQLDAEKLNRLLDGLRQTADGFVQAGSQGKIRRVITAYMRYAGQGWEIPIHLPDRKFTAADKAWFENVFQDSYTHFFGRAVQGLEIEFVTLAVNTLAEEPPVPFCALREDAETVWADNNARPVFDPATGQLQASQIVERDNLQAGMRVSGPAMIVERETSTVITTLFDAIIQGDGSILLLRKEESQ